ncbi:MAG: hypothetical protein AB1449_08450 [Chloroflexota bacterium]
MDERRAARVDGWLLLLRVGTSLLGRRALPLLPARGAEPFSLMSSILTLSPGILLSGASCSSPSVCRWPSPHSTGRFGPRPRAPSASPPRWGCWDSLRSPLG